MHPWEIVAALVAVGILIVIALAMRTASKNRYIGYGWTLDWKQGDVIVVSRLLDSPSGRAGVRIGSILVSWNNQSLQFSSGQEWIEFMKSIPPTQLGDSASFQINDGKSIRTITMQAEVIQGPIPVHRIPHIPEGQAHLVQVGLAWCPKTGQFVFPTRLSSAAVDDILER